MITDNVPTTTIPASLIRRSLCVLLKIALSLAMLVFVGYFSIAVCPLIWPSLSYTVNEPKLEDFCGRYIPMPGTAQFLAEKYPGAQPSLVFDKDGSFAFDDIPSASQTANENTKKKENGKWKFAGSRILLSENEGSFLYSSLRLKGQKPPYIIERWNDFPMQFCSNPQLSPAVRAYTSLSITDFAVQGLVALSVLVLPLFLGPGSGIRAFGYPFMIIFMWGIWRMAYFDPATHNDIPGMGYIVCAFGYALIARGVFAVRCTVLRRLSARKDTQGDNQLA